MDRFTARPRRSPTPGTNSTAPRASKLAPQPILPKTTPSATATIWCPGLTSIAAQGYEFQYGYVPSSNIDLVKTLRVLFVKETEFAYEPGRDAISSVTNRIGFNHERLLSQYGYAINADGQRTARTTTHGGDTFTDCLWLRPRHRRPHQL